MNDRIMNGSRFEGRTAIITGASSGIGEATARRLAREGGAVFLLARREDRLETIGRDLLQVGCDVAWDTCDVTVAESVKASFDRFAEWHETADILVNCAGLELMLPVGLTTESKWHECLETNLGGTVRGIQSFIRLPRPQNRGRAIVSVSSVYALGGAPAMSMYSAAKGAIVSMSRCLALELAARAIRVNVVAAGIVETDMSARTFAKFGRDRTEELRGKYPLGFGTAQDVASAIAFLASDEARWITGTVLTVDGGYLAR